MVETRLYAVLALAPSALVFPIAIVELSGIVGERAILDWLLYALPLVLVGFLLYIVAMRRYIAHLREHERVLVEWTAQADTRYRWVVRGLLFVISITFIIGGFVAIFSFDTETDFLPIFGGMFLGYAIAAGRTKRYTLFESGLALRASGTVSGAFVPIERLRSVARSDRALTIYRGLPWPFPLRSSIANLENPDEVESVLRDRLG